jgi:hypothetical protein
MEKPERRCKQILDNLKETGGYLKLEEVALRGELALEEAVDVS